MNIGLMAFFRARRISMGDDEPTELLSTRAARPCARERYAGSKAFAPTTSTRGRCATPEHLDIRRNLLLMAKFRHEFRESLDVAPGRRREGRDEFVDERLVERQIETAPP